MIEMKPALRIAIAADFAKGRARARGLLNRDSWASPPLGAPSGVAHHVLGPFPACKILIISRPGRFSTQLLFLIVPSFLLWRHIGPPRHRYSSVFKLAPHLVQDTPQ